MNGPRILVIEDDLDMANFICLELSVESYTVQVVNTGQAGLIAARQQPPALIILDRGLPDMDGLDICQRLSQTSSIPILMLTAKNEVDERVKGLDAGANDYLVKPFHLSELLARVRAQLRISQPVTPHCFEFAYLTLDTQLRQVWSHGKSVDLSPKEFELLLFFMQHPRQVLPKSRIIESVWGWDFEGDASVLNYYIHSLRKKLENKQQGQILHTAYGVGYILKERNQ